MTVEQFEQMYGVIHIGLLFVVFGVFAAWGGTR